MPSSHAGRRLAERGVVPEKRNIPWRCPGLATPALVAVGDLTGFTRWDATSLVFVPEGWRENSLAFQRQVSSEGHPESRKGRLRIAGDIRHQCNSRLATGQP
jgi:hypothetical protein